LERITISIVIPTCDRKSRLLSLLQDLNASSYPPDEVIIVDSGDDWLLTEEYSAFKNLAIKYVSAERSVCIQRNTGIRMARSSWIFLCDDDIEMPADYLQTLVAYVLSNPEAGAVSGQWKQKENNEWTAGYPVRSGRLLFWKYFFQLGIWGEIDCRSNNVIIRKIKSYYKRKGNHISKAGWPVNTELNSDHTICPVYSLGASLIKKEWLLQSPYDEVLDRHGIGDNYGVAVDFPVRGIHIVNKTFVHHHREQGNRLKTTLQYYRRILALAYFIRVKKVPGVKRRWLVWSLTGNMISFIFSGNGSMIRASWKAIWKIIFGRNPYYRASKKGQKIVEPAL
jgi:glycosyltransferase involved in cell wall biosynthesis